MLHSSNFAFYLKIEHLRRFNQKQNLQVSFESVRRLPASGPRTAERAYTLAVMLITKGLFLVTTVYLKIFICPQNISEAPIPATALPMMKVMEFGARAHMIETISKIKRTVM